jgi:adenylate cyclase
MNSTESKPIGPIEKMTVLFSDISGSTRLYEQLGDTDAKLVVAGAIETMSQCVADQGGQLRRIVGDEILCTFSSPGAAAHAAISMHTCIEMLLPKRVPQVPANFAIHVGMAHGPIIEDGEELYGDTVNVAARLCSHAKRRQILTTAETAKLITSEITVPMRVVDQISVRGRAEPVRVYEINWSADFTRMERPEVAPVPAAGLLQLRYDDQVMAVDNNRPTVVLGREGISDFVVDASLASREHCRIEQRRNRFFVIDISTNGTYVRTSSEIHYLLHDEMELTGSGALGLGRDPETADRIVYFECKKLRRLDPVRSRL